MPTFRRNEVAVAAALALSFVTSVALAQSNGTDNTQPQRIEITGSNIKRIDAETSSPVQVYHREDIARSGATSVREFLDLMPGMNSNALSDISGSNSFAGGASGADLRNLGKQSTLVLLNSRRVAPYALADFNEVFTNLDSLPLDAVERIEILRNGASAIYGSDAVAGVINIITRKDYQGLEVGADYQKSLTSHRFGEGSARVTAGFGNFETDRFNVLANLEIFHRDSVMWRDVLPYADPVMLANIPQGNAQFSTFSYPGNIIGQGPLPGCTTVIGNLCRYDRYTRFQAQPAADRVNTLLSGRLNLGNDMEAFAELLYSHTKTTYLSPFTNYGSFNPPEQWGNASTGGTETFFYVPLPSTHPLNQTGDAAELRYRFVDAPSQAVDSSDNYRLVTGLKGNLKGYDWESALSFLGSSADDAERGRFSVSGFKQTIGDYTNVDPNTGIPNDPNFFNQPNGYHLGQPNSPDVINTLFPTYGTKGKTTQVAWDGKVTGDLTQLPAGPLGFAAGFDLRHEKFTLSPSENLLIGDIVGFGVTETHASRNFGAVFAELNAPLAKNLETQVAARIDKFPNFGAHVSPKLGLRYQPAKELLLRGTVEGGFRAPNLTESAPSKKTSFENGVSDPKRCAQATAYANDLIAQSNALAQSDPAQSALLAAQADIVRQNECAAGVPNITSYNPELKPEVSRSFSLGLVLEPSRSLNMSMDYWNIHRKDEIGLKTTQELLAEEGNLPPGVAVTRNDFSNLALDPTFNTPQLRQQYGVTVGSIQSITNRFENVSRTKTSGVDVGVNATVPTPVGKIGVGLQSTYLINYYSYSTIINAYGDNLAGRYGYPRFKATLDANLDSGSMVNGLRLVHIGQQALQGDYFDTDWSTQGCADNFGIDAAHCRVAPYSRLDYYFVYKGLKNMTVSVFLRNVLNQYPPFDYKALFQTGGLVIPQQQEDAQRRTLKVAVDFKFW